MANSVFTDYPVGIDPSSVAQAQYLSDRQLRRVLKEYILYFNEDRPHQGIGQHIPLASNSQPRVDGAIRLIPVLSGLHHTYFREVA